MSSRNQSLIGILHEVAAAAGVVVEVVVPSGGGEDAIGSRHRLNNGDGDDEF
jgi:hypothetical protein